MHTGTRFITIVEAAVGMVLAESISLSSDGFLRLKLARGHVLTANCINQLIVHGAEYIAISEPDDRSDDQIALDQAAALQRVQTVFYGADMDDANTAALYHQVKIFRSAS
jgi:hypothetical protein